MRLRFGKPTAHPPASSRVLPVVHRRRVRELRWRGGADRRPCDAVERPHAADLVADDDALRSGIERAAGDAGGRAARGELAPARAVPLPGVAERRVGTGRRAAAAVQDGAQSHRVVDERVAAARGRADRQVELLPRALAQREGLVVEDRQGARRERLVAAAEHDQLVMDEVVDELPILHRDEPGRRHARALRGGVARHEPDRRAAVERDEPVAQRVVDEARTEDGQRDPRQDRHPVRAVPGCEVALQRAQERPLGHHLPQHDGPLPDRVVDGGAAGEQGVDGRGGHALGGCGGGEDDRDGAKRREERLHADFGGLAHAPAAQRA